MEEDKRLYNEFILGNNDAFEQIMNKYRRGIGGLLNPFII